MTSGNAVPIIVILFGIIFLALIFVMVLGYRRSQKETRHQEISQKTQATPTHAQKTESPQAQVSPAQVPQAQVPQAQVLQGESAQTDQSGPVPSVVDESVVEEPVFEEPTEAPRSLTQALAGTRQRFWGRLQALWSQAEVAQIDDIEEVLYTSDLGPQTVERLLARIKESLSASEKKDPDVVRAALRAEILQIFEQSQGPSESEELFRSFEFRSPSVWMVVGVNGAGKTTSIGKMASQLARSGKKVLLAAGDTFRAAAGNQLRVWTERAQVEIFSPEGVTDPSAVAFDAVQKGLAKGFDVIIVDTAGRLHTQQNLMEEIKKMKRVVQKVIPEAPHEVLLVLDSNQGQNALLQAKEFHRALGVTGVVLTKLDGTAKGGVAVGVAHELELPIKLIGVGEKMEDLRPFSPKSFVESIL